MRARPLTASALVAFALALVPIAASAATPGQHGWWTSSNQGAVAGPAPPDVPAGGMLIEGGVGSTQGSSNGSPSAFAALVYDVPEGAVVGRLTLAVAPNSATVPAVTLELCPLRGATFKAEQGGPMSDAPSFECQKNVTAPPSSSGGAYQFDVSSLVTAGSLAVAILPTTPGDRVVLAAPDSNSLSVQPSSGSSDTGAGSLAPKSDSAGRVSGVAAPAGPALTDALPSPSVPAVGSPITADERRQPAPLASGAQYFPTSTTSDRHTRGIALALLVAGATVVAGGWFAIGRIAANRTLSVIAGPEGGAGR